MIEDDMLPAGVFGTTQGQDEVSFVDVEGDRWFPAGQQEE